MVWGCMTDSEFDEIFIYQGRMDSTKYVSVLESGLMPTFSKLSLETNKDGVKKSACAIAQFRENCIELLEWPAQTLDLNLCKNVRIQGEWELRS